MNQRTESMNQELNPGIAAPRINAGAMPFTMYQVYLLEKLGRMRRNRQEYGYRPDGEQWVLKAMDRSIYSAYLDCLNEGLGREAGSILSGGEGELPRQPGLI